MVYKINNSNEYRNKLKVHLPIAKDPTIIILRGHLLIEELFDYIIFDYLKNPSAIDDARFTFFQKMRLVQGIFGYRDEFTWRPIEALNRLRNQIGHTLPNEQFINQIDVVLKIFFKEDFDDIPKDIYSKSKALRQGITMHCAFLSGMIDGRAISKQEK